MSFVRGRRQAARVGLLAALVGTAAGGCRSDAPYAEASLAEATVSGRVTSGGTAVTKGQVIFDPANVKRKTVVARAAEIRSDGTYEVKTLIGANRVTVAIPDRRTKAGAPYFQRIFDVKSGSNTFDIPLN
jgi:FlaG/FlaF family flagellin (archaellin)